MAKLGIVTISVSVGGTHFVHVTRLIRIHVEPLTLSLINHTTIEIRQGETHVALSNKHLGADSNGARKHLVYHITTKPENGSLIWKETKRKANTFSQHDLDQQRIFYAQENLETWRDSFVFEVSNAHNRMSDKVAEIVVRPNVVQNPVKVEPGGHFILTSQLLDASALEGRAPRFLIIKAPLFGRLIINRLVKQKVRKREIEDETEEEKEADGETEKEVLQKDAAMMASVDKLAPMDDEETIKTVIHSDVSFFTFDDVKAGTIRYINTIIGETALEESFEYELHATGVQPARGLFLIQIISPDDVTPGKGGKRPQKPPPVTTEAPVDTPLLPRISQSLALPVFFVVAIFIFALLIILVRRYRIRKKRERKYIKEKQKELLEQRQAFEVASPQPDLLGELIVMEQLV